jgi:hypothetical protein
MVRTDIGTWQRVVYGGDGEDGGAGSRGAAARRRVRFVHQHDAPRRMQRVGCGAYQVAYFGVVQGEGGRQYCECWAELVGWSNEWGLLHKFTFVEESAPPLDLDQGSMVDYLSSHRSAGFAF